MTDLIAIDPGGAKKGCSAAHFAYGKLVQVFERIYAEDAASFAGEINVVVIERPQQDGRSRAVPPRVLIDLAWQGALVAGAFVGCGARLVELAPADWKGSIQKAMHHAAMIETGAITADELNRVWGGQPIHREVFEARRKGALCRWKPHANGHYAAGSRTPDIFDAIGLGLFHLGRIDKDGKRK